jgi:hypothetical protein
MNTLMTALVGALGTSALYFMAFAGPQAAWAFLSEFVGNRRADTLHRVTDQVFGFWPETAVLIQLFMVTPALALVAAPLALFVLHVMAPSAGWGGGQRLGLCIALSFLLVRFAYLFLKPQMP